MAIKQSASSGGWYSCGAIRECGSWRRSCQQEEKKKAGRQIDPPTRQNAGHWSKTIGNVNDSIEAGARLVGWVG
ncbi:hypothetical protein CCHR01_13290 [Colletotrichum chrysophilum]|uniref:Uncharacterized protein n=1 Tax=Colletotrichum chrysophilum TaxID=1836956 RepID=A0AAD9A9N8_9PEZI|nr:hypothetical protein CCHR01_13290 [Colletotrichum chrysophilum]